MRLDEEKNVIQMSPGELADLIEGKRQVMIKEGSQKSYLDFMKIMLEAYDSIIYALRLVDAENSENGKDKPVSLSGR